MSTEDASSRSDAARRMNRMHRWTRHVYDSTRRYYHLGRDAMLDRIATRPAGNVLEVGCGSARNLRVLDSKAPQHALYGLDASLAILAMAREKLEQTGRTEHISLTQGLAQDLNPKTQFGVDDSFDIIFFSYVLSTIPTWETTLDAALDHLAPNGRLYIVDFWDQADLPPVVGTVLQRWLRLFDVEPRPDLLDTLHQLDTESHLSCSITSVARRYAYLATVARRDNGSQESDQHHRPGQPDASFKSKRVGSKNIIAA